MLEDSDARTLLYHAGRIHLRSLLEELGVERIGLREDLSLVFCWSAAVQGVWPALLFPSCVWSYLHFTAANIFVGSCESKMLALPDWGFSSRHGPATESLAALSSCWKIRNVCYRRTSCGRLWFQKAMVSSGAWANVVPQHLLPNFWSLLCPVGSRKLSRVQAEGAS